MFWMQLVRWRVGAGERGEGRFATYINHQQLHRLLRRKKRHKNKLHRLRYPGHVSRNRIPGQNRLQNRLHRLVRRNRIPGQNRLHRLR